MDNRIKLEQSDYTDLDPFLYTELLETNNQGKIFKYCF